MTINGKNYRKARRKFSLLLWYRCVLQKEQIYILIDIGKRI